MICTVLVACKDDQKGDTNSGKGMPMDESIWTEVSPVTDKIIIDLKYATVDNRFERAFYDCPKCFLVKGAALGLQALADSLRKDGYTLKVLDCYRPKSVHEEMSNQRPEEVLNNDGLKMGMHARGMAVDITLCDQNGVEIDMGSKFGSIGPSSYHDHAALTLEVRTRRAYLLNICRHFGFQGIKTEWWHYAFRHSSHVMQDQFWNCD